VEEEKPQTAPKFPTLDGTRSRESGAIGTLSSSSSPTFVEENSGGDLLKLPSGSMAGASSPPIQLVKALKISRRDLVPESDPADLKVVAEKVRQRKSESFKSVN
jgi:hypothetical protein